MKKIAIIGGGILGLMSLYELTCRFGRAVRVDLFAEDLFTRRTCSFRKGGFVDPFLSSGEHIQRWTRATYELYERLHGSAPGVLRRTLRVFLEQDASEPAGLANWPASSQAGPLDVPLPAGFAGGFRLETFALDQERFLPWLLSACMGNDVEIHLRRLTSLDELAGHDAVIAAMGVGARTFGQDVTPVRGQWLLLDGDLSGTAIGNGIYFAARPVHKHLAYAVGGEGWTLVGGTAQTGDTDVTLRPEDENRFLDATAELVPDVKRMAVRTRGVQFRPGGGPARIVCAVSGGMPIYHLLCPGSSGISLCAGYAQDVVQLIHETIGE